MMTDLIKSRKYVIAFFIIVMFIVSFLITFFAPAPRVKLGDQLIPCNPKAKINLKKKYNLRLWDYDLPIGEDPNLYRNYLHKAVLAFQKQYPNVKVEITLLDILNGPVQLAQAIRNNEAPDVYCSFYNTPKFDYKKQIPVGFFLKKEEREVYEPNILNLMRISGVQCYFPRWTAPPVWIGNKSLLEKAGLPVAGIQVNGWSWEQVIALGKNVPEGKYLFVGSLGYNGFFAQFTATDNGRMGNIGNGLDLLETLISQKAVPSEIEQNMLGRFLSGQSLLLAGVRPVVYKYIKTKLMNLKSDWTPVILPEPYLPARKAYFTENGVICVYRNGESAGDEHIAAAVKLGQFLSNYGTGSPWEQMMVIPATQKASRRFRKDYIRTLGESGAFDYWDSFPKLEDITEDFNYMKKIYPALQEYCSGKISKEAAEKILRGE